MTTLEKQWRLIAYMQEPTPHELGFDMNDPEDRAMYEHEIDIATARLMGKPLDQYFVRALIDTSK